METAVRTISQTPKYASKLRAEGGNGEGVSITDKTSHRLLAKGIVDYETLQKALALKDSEANRKNRRNLGQILVREFGVDHDTVFREVADLYAFREINLANENIDGERANFIRRMVDLLPEKVRDLLVEIKTLPLKYDEREPNRLIMIAADPTDQDIPIVVRHFGVRKYEVAYACLKDIQLLCEQIIPARKESSKLLDTSEITLEDGDEEEAKEILKDLADRVPSTAFGLERQMFIGELVGRIDSEKRTAVKKILDDFLLKMYRLEASDIELGSHGCSGQVWYRIFGSKKPDPSWGTYTADEVSFLIQNVLTDTQKTFLYENRNLDFSYSLSDQGSTRRLRADAYFDLDHLALNMRAISSYVRPYKNLELHPNIGRVLNLGHTKEGLTLVTGITGSGKSSTLDTIIDANNHAVEGHIVIIASPVEYVHSPARCVIRHREVGRDVLSFRDGVVQSLRQDPDIVVIGEMRDPETMMTALEITDSGHKVFSTLHTASAVESIHRIIGEVASLKHDRVRERLADVLKCVISQKLIPNLDGQRILAKEILLVTPGVRAAIKNGNTQEIYQMIAESGQVGMITMEQDLRRLYFARKISLETAMDYANNKKRMEQLLTVMSKPD